ELAAALKVAQDAVRARTQFVAAASHDLRQPLYAISILADTLSSEALSATGNAVLEKQRYAIDLLRTLFDNLLDLSRFDAGEVRLSPRVMRLRDVLVPLATEYELLCHAKRLDFRVETAEVFVRPDAALIRR